MLTLPYERELIHAERARRFSVRAAAARTNGSRVRRWWYAWAAHRAERRADPSSVAVAPTARVDRGRSSIDRPSRVA